MRAARFACCLAVAALLTAAAAAAPAAETWSRLNALLDQADRALAGRDDARAESLYRDAAGQARVFGDPNLFLARALDGLGDVGRRAGRYADAETLYRRAAEMWVHLLGRDQPRLATTLHHLGIVCAEQGRAGEASGHLREALAIWEARFGPASPQAENTRRALRKLE